MVTAKSFFKVIIFWDNFCKEVAVPKDYINSSSTYLNYFSQSC